MNTPAQTPGPTVSRPLMGYRLAVGALGLLVGVYGAYLGWSRLTTTAAKISTAKWLIGGIIVHDGLIALASIGVGMALVKLVPTWARGAASAGFIILSTVTVVAVPQLGRYGERAANPTLLDRNYTVGWIVFAAIVLVGVVVGAALARRRATGTAEGVDTDVTGAGGRRRPDGA